MANAQIESMLLQKLDKIEVLKFKYIDGSRAVVV